jgi:hypothetical protein
MVPVSCTSTIETMETNIEAGIIILARSESDQYRVVWEPNWLAYNGIEALSAVFSINSL